MSQTTVLNIQISYNLNNVIEPDCKENHVSYIKQLQIEDLVGLHDTKVNVHREDYPVEHIEIDDLLEDFIAMFLRNTN